MLFSALFMATLSTGLLRVDTSVGCPRAPSTPPLSAKSSRSSSVGSSPHSSVASSEDVGLCRICYGGASPHRPLLQNVCLCKSVVHFKCLTTWIEYSQQTRRNTPPACEVCLSPYVLPDELPARIPPPPPPSSPPPLTTPEPIASCGFATG